MKRKVLIIALVLALIGGSALFTTNSDLFKGKIKTGANTCKKQELDGNICKTCYDYNGELFSQDCEPIPGTEIEEGFCPPTYWLNEVDQRILSEIFNMSEEDACSYGNESWGRFDLDIADLYEAGISSEIANAYKERFDADDIIDLYEAGISSEIANAYNERFDKYDIVDLYEANVSSETANAFYPSVNVEQIITLGEEIDEDDEDDEMALINKYLESVYSDRGNYSLGEDDIANIIMLLELDITVDVFVACAPLYSDTTGLLRVIRGFTTEQMIDYCSNMDRWYRL